MRRAKVRAKAAKKRREKEGKMQIDVPAVSPGVKAGEEHAGAAGAQRCVDMPDASLKDSTGG